MPPWLRCSAARFFQQISSYTRLVTYLLSLLIPVFVALFPVFSAILLRCYFPFVGPPFCFSRLLRFCCPVAFSDCVAPLRLFGHYSVFVFGALRARLELEILSALFRVGLPGLFAQPARD